jgi:PH domain of plant-specific actin-binding protein/Ig domain of plant-specific actin-binding protein
MQALQANLAADEATVQEAKQQTASVEKALGEAKATIATLQRESAERQQALESAVARAEALEAKLAAVEANLQAIHAVDASATVEDAAAEAPAAQSKVVLSLTLAGACSVGSTLRVGGITGLPHVTFQWYRTVVQGQDEPIGGATRQQYAPEPRDIGLVLRCAVVASPGEAPQWVSSPEPIADMEGLAATVSGAAGLESVEFNCVVVQRNGEMQDRREVHILEVLSDRIKLKRAGKTRYKESYNDQMQVCGARGGGDAAAQGLFLCLGPTLVFMLALESAKQRNAAIQLIRMRAGARGFTVLGPKDKP